MNNTKLILPLVLGLSLVSVTALVVYYVFKKEEDESEKPIIKTGRSNVIEIQVSKSIVPALIGRGGSNLKEIEAKSGAKINFKKFSDKDYDVCIIRGRPELAQLAETLIHEFIRNQPVIENDTMLVPEWACGRIIGTRGESINDICHRSGARVKVESSTGADGSMRTVNFRGTQEQIRNAKALIENCVSQQKCRREVEQWKRTPRHTQSASAHSNEAEEMPGDTNTAPIPKHVTNKSEVAGPAIKVYVSAVSSPSRFWVQVVGSQEKKLDSLVEQMTEYYGNKDNRAMHELSSVQVGQVVAAVFRHDGRWYRARVADVRPNEFDATKQVADVFYLDYGDSEYVATHELCELGADFLGLRFQAIECFLAGVRPCGDETQTTAVTASGHRWEKWTAEAVERFEELAQVARWKALVSKTCTYRKSMASDGGKEKEVLGIKLCDVTDKGEIDIGATMIAEGLAEETHPVPAATQPTAPFGDLGSSRVLGMLDERSDRSASLPRHLVDTLDNQTDNEEGKPTSSSVGSDLNKSGDTGLAASHNLSYPDSNQFKPQTNGSHDSFLNAERHNFEKGDSGSNETLVPLSPGPILGKSQRDELKANMNRIDSHHKNLHDFATTNNQYL